MCDSNALKLEAARDLDPRAYSYQRTSRCGSQTAVQCALPRFVTMLCNLTLAQVRTIISLSQALDTDRISDLRAAFDSFYEYVQSLGHEARMELMALMWIGRGFEGSFADAVQYAYANSDEGDVLYIVEKSPDLSAYLSRGLTLLHLAL
jgi:hypothetical protein